MNFTRFLLLLIVTITTFACGNVAGDKKEAYDITVSKSPMNAGSVFPSSDTVVSGNNKFWVLAKAGTEYKFSHWSGDIDSTSENPLSITVDQAYNLNANFEVRNYPLAVKTSGKGAVSEKVVQSKSYNHGTVVQLSANPAPGWQLREWQGDLSGTQNPVQITVNTPKDVTAVFERADYTAPLLKLYDVTSITQGPFSQAMEYVDGELLMFTASSGHDSFDGLVQRIDISDYSLIGKQEHNLGHANNASYDDSSDVMLMGSLPGFHGNEGKMYLLYNFSSYLGSGRIDFHAMDKKVINVSSISPSGEFDKLVAAFGEPNQGKRNIVYISGGYSKNWAKLKLGMGSNKLANGTFEAGLPPHKYNGTYKVIWNRDYTIKDQNHFGVIQGTEWSRNMLFTADGHDGLFVSFWRGLQKGDSLKREVIKTQIYNQNTAIGDTTISEGITEINGNYYMGVVIGNERYVGKFEL